MDVLAAAAQFRRAVQLFAASLSEETALEIASIYPVWNAGTTYSAGDYVSYETNSVGDPQLYRVVTGHTSQEDWTPAETASLYTPLGLTEDGTPVWSRPTGAHDAYNLGDIVSYNGKLYKSIIDGNVWPPNSYADGWEIYLEV